MTTIADFQCNSTDNESCYSGNNLFASLLEYTLYCGRCNVISS